MVGIASALQLVQLKKINCSSMWRKISAENSAREIQASSVEGQLLYTSMQQVHECAGKTLHDFKSILPSPACQSGWLRFGDSCYKEAGLSNTAQEAEDLCLEQDSHIFMPESVEEWDWVTEVFK